MLAAARGIWKLRLQARSLTTATRTLPSSAYTAPSTTQCSATSSAPEDITEAERCAVDAALRVDQAGEVAANYIYMGQHAVLGRDRKVGPLIEVRHSIPVSVVM